jgi:hypothetical protein
MKKAVFASTLLAVLVSASVLADENRKSAAAKFDLVGREATLGGLTVSLGYAARNYRTGRENRSIQRLVDGHKANLDGILKDVKLATDSLTPDERRNLLTKGMAELAIAKNQSSQISGVQKMLDAVKATGVPSQMERELRVATARGRLSQAELRFAEKYAAISELGFKSSVVRIGAALGAGTGALMIGKDLYQLSTGKAEAHRVISPVISRVNSPVK